MLAVLEASLFPLGQFQGQVGRRRRRVRPQVEPDSRFSRLFLPAFVFGGSGSNRSGFLPPPECSLPPPHHPPEATRDRPTPAAPAGLSDDEGQRRRETCGFPAFRDGSTSSGDPERRRLFDSFLDLKV